MGSRRPGHRGGTIRVVPRPGAPVAIGDAPDCEGTGQAGAGVTQPQRQMRRLLHQRLQQCFPTMAGVAEPSGFHQHAEHGAPLLDALQAGIAGRSTAPVRQRRAMRPAGRGRDRDTFSARAGRPPGPVGPPRADRACRWRETPLRPPANPQSQLATSLVVQTDRLRTAWPRRTTAPSAVARCSRASSSARRVSPSAGKGSVAWATRSRCTSRSMPIGAGCNGARSTPRRWITSIASALRKSPHTLSDGPSCRSSK